MSERSGLQFADVNLQRHLTIRAIGLLLVVAVIYVVRPLVHGLVYQTLYSPSGLLVIGATTLVGLVLWFLPPFAAAPVSGILRRYFGGAAGVVESETRAACRRVHSSVARQFRLLGAGRNGNRANAGPGYDE
ncbi:MAG: hypothetical protein A07HN63_00517 [uncultured archaeon A07HN63]|nr:MAG: hypothetical protein A07HN63_00517 [uncultured archaeon A07HN63]